MGLVSAPYYVEVAATPGTPVITLAGSTLVSSADEGNQWYIDGNLIQGATGKEYVPVAAGSYTVIVTLNDCSSLPSNSIYFDPVSVEENITGTSMTVYPNPNAGQFSLKLFSVQSRICTLEIYNNQGGLVMKQENLKVEGNVIVPVSLTSLQPGVYMAVLRNGDSCLKAKINVNR